MRSILAFLFVASLLPACSDPAPTDPRNDPDKPNEPVALVCGLMRAACEKQVACGHPILNNTPGDVDACLEAQRCESVVDVLASPDVVVDAGAVEACEAAIEAASCGALAAQGLSIDPSCEHYLVGTRGEGESCRGGAVSDCEAGLACVFEGDTCPGTCTRAPERCTEGSCGPDAFCASNGTCEARAQVGEACDETQLDFSNLGDEPCVAGAHCDNFVCVADLDAGASCAGKSPRACGEGAACLCEDPASCASEADYACRPARAEGEPCNMAFDCADGLFCNFDDEGRCAARGGLGAACGGSFGACQHPLECVDGTCAGEEPIAAELPLLEEGQSCVESGSCPLGTACTCDNENCTEKRCLPAPGLGESCEALMLANVTPFACAEGLCDILAGYTCVLPAAAGEPCPVDGLTLACASLVCTGGKCASMEETRCEE
ncbi:hypothetical protein [Polyangium spumosum]|uniref:Dickkopf N-terminal cysteine-rich domain-containing protein n=1 Tax=Polyangium spumosum TaxID=889282 RepID=A0A6N7PQM6_9BACT|nr:hypothetical protein [Polyangium spumosum]MRG94368.1 hypothetical protein [Polyangium spumosum]